MILVVTKRCTGSIATNFRLPHNYYAGKPVCTLQYKYGLRKAAGSDRFVETSVSTVEIDEYTRAANGVLQPDIVIPYVAADYLTGRDAMLDLLIEIIIRSRADTTE